MSISVKTLRNMFYSAGVALLSIAATAEVTSYEVGKIANQGMEENQTAFTNAVATENATMNLDDKAYESASKTMHAVYNESSSGQLRNLQEGTEATGMLAGMVGFTLLASFMPPIPIKKYRSDKPALKGGPR